MRKPETQFRIGRVKPFLATLLKTVAFPIQQVAIHDDPDFILCINGRFVALELKSNGEEPRPLQQYKLCQVKRMGGVALVANPGNWEEIKEALKQLDQGGQYGMQG